MTKAISRSILLSSVVLFMVVSLCFTAQAWADESSFAGDQADRISALTLSGEDDALTSLEPSIPSSYASPKITWKRLAGSNALETMQKIVREGWKDGCGGTVVLATAASYKDALSASGVAGLSGAPILLTQSDALSSQTKSELKRIKPSTVIVAGGPNAISRSTFNAIKSLLPEAKVVRTYGRTATGTAAALNKEYFGKKSSVAILATSKNYKDALSAAPIAYAKHYPLFLTENASTISNETLNAMKACGIKQVIVIGGTSAINNSVVDKLKSKGITLKKRLGGKNSYDTSNKVANYAVSLGMKATNTGAATAKGYKDALCGAALCGKKNSALVLVDMGKNNCINGFVKKNEYSITKGYIFGGKVAVNDSVATLLQTPSINYRSIYGELLRKAKNGSKPFDYMFSNGQYAVEDIDKDGIYELIVATGASGMNGHALFFTIRYGKAVQCIDFYHFEASMLGYFKNGKMYHEYYGPGIYGIDSLSLNGTKLVTKQLYSHTGTGMGPRGYISGDTPAARQFWANNPKGKNVSWVYSLNDYSKLPS
ncbi:MAG: cell wall-binding repeat-containing protein [Eggerthellaceae bacterium]|nr:cell wall-binding repeat-containing protein [Eggerthellaceae bacterium]